MTSALIVVGILFSGAINVWCQEPPQNSAIDEYQKHLKKLVDRIITAKMRDDPKAALDVEFSVHRNNYLFALSLVAKFDENKRSILVSEIEEARVDKQVGGSNANAGSTSLVTKGSVPSILGLAVENGALMRTDSGTTITFRGNPIGFIKALGEKGFIASYEDDGPTTRLLRRLSFALSFDTNRGDEQGTFTGDRQQLSAYSFRFDIINKRDPRHSSYKKKWDNLIYTKAQAITSDLRKLFVKYFSEHPAFLAWHESAKKAVAETEMNAVERVLKEEIHKLQALELSPDIEGLIKLFAKNLNDYLQNRDAILKDVANGAIVTFEYMNILQVDAPNLSNFKLIYEDSLFKGKADLAFNASATVFDSKPKEIDIGTVHSLELGAQLDVPLGQVQKIGNFVVSFAGIYERMMENAITPGGMMIPDTKGHLAMGQMKLTIPAKGSGVKILFSVTFANRTELIKESEVRGNLGVTFDIDSLFARFQD